MKQNHICEELKTTSTEVKTWLSQQPNVKEESITDWLLYDLSKKIKYLKYYLFTRNEEGGFSGADWEWWIITNRGSFAARIQAKKIKNNGDNYPYIAYSNKTNLQIELLIDDAEKNGFAPLYTFYTKEYSTLKCGAQIDNEGVYIASAVEIHNNFIKKPRHKIGNSDLLKLCNPLSCLLCCPVVQSEKHLMDGLKKYFSQYYDFRKNNNQNINPTPGFFDKIPNYVSNLLGYENIPDWWEREFQYDIQNIKGIALLDLKNIQ